MRFLLQRCLAGRAVIHPPQGMAYESGRIGRGFVALVGFGAADGPDLPGSHIWNGMIEKMLNLRVFPDEMDKMNRSLTDCGGSLLVVSQFTLYADSRRGRRPAFTGAAQPAVAEGLYLRLLADLAARVGQEHVAHGVFGACMDVELTNWGPVTIWLDSAELFPNG